METCRSKLKSDDSVTLSKRTWSRATMESEPSCRTGRQQSCWERLCLDPTHNNSVLSVLSLRWLAHIQRPTSVMHCSSLAAADAVSVRRQYVSSANACRNTSCFSAIAARSAVQTMNNSGPSTEPCGTEQTM